MDEAETTDSASIYKLSDHNVQDELKYSIESSFQEKSIPYHSINEKTQPFHLEEILFLNTRKEGTFESTNGDNSKDQKITKLQEYANRNFLVRKCLQLQNFIHVLKKISDRRKCHDFLLQYYSLRKKNGHLHSYKSVRFSNRKLLSTSLKSYPSNQNSKGVPTSSFKRKRKKRRNYGMTVHRKKTEGDLKHSIHIVPVNATSNISNSSKVNLEKLALEEIKDYEEFVALMEQTFSKDPLRALLSVSFLLIVMMLAIKFCGMRPTRQHHEKFYDLHEDIHYVNIHDILKHKRPYLPKYLLTWERRLRRKFKRRQRRKKEREQEIVETPLSDNSEEESLIYGRNFDF